MFRTVVPTQFTVSLNNAFLWSSIDLCFLSMSAYLFNLSLYIFGLYVYTSHTRAHYIFFLNFPS